MDKLLIRGGVPLAGRVECSGSKNAALPLLAATVLAEGECRIENVPRLNDIDTLVKILGCLGVTAERDAAGAVATRVESEGESVAPYELVRTMRASVCVLGPLLAKRGYARVALPGGCVIGARPIDLHLKGLAALGARIEVAGGYVTARAERLRGARVYLGGAFGSSVLGTANVMMAAAMAEGRTVIEHAACEPELVDLANFLTAMGASIEGAGSHRIVIRGVKRLDGTAHRVIPDRIEAGTYLLAGAATRGEVEVAGARPEHLDALFDALGAAGVEVEATAGGLAVRAGARPKAVEVTTLPYPGFPTDLQAQFMALMTLSEGASVITEKVYPERFMHVGELARLGAEITREGPTAVVTGVERLAGAPVMASDLRASAALVLAALAAEGETEVRRVYHLDRGYDGLTGKLRALGARIERLSD